jgi:hypothetical protein
MRSIELIYLLFAVVHPLTELINKTSLRLFLNKVYYKTNRDDFPVDKIAGIGGSLLVLVILIIPLCGFGGGEREEGWVGWWCLALGLVVADVIQHAVHIISRPWQLAPRVHLFTILGVLFPLLCITAGLHPKLDLLKIGCLGLLLIGALLIFLNWLRNSWRVSSGQ